MLCRAIRRTGKKCFPLLFDFLTTLVFRQIRFSLLFYFKDLILIYKNNHTGTHHV